MDLKSKQRNIPLMYAIAFFQGIVLYASISTLYRQARGLTLAEYAVIDGFSYIFQLAFEIPFGMLADRIGYKKTLIFSNGLYLISKLIFWQAFGFTSFLMERLFFSMALAGLSGLDVSILYLSCDGHDSQKVFSRSSAIATAGMLTGCLIFTLFLSHHYEAAAFGTVITYGIAFVLSFFVCDVRDVDEKEARPSLRRLTDILKITLKDRKFLLFILGDALICYGVWASRILLSQQKFIELGLTEQHIGWIEILLACLALTAVYSATLTKKLGFKKFLVTCVTTVAVSVLLLGLTGDVLLAVFSSALIEVFYNFLAPLVNDLYSKRVTVSDRATQLSVYAMITELFSFGISFVMSLITAHTYSGSFLFCAGIILMGLLLSLSCYKGIHTLDET